MALEEDFAQTTRFVEIDKRNHATFSLEFVKLLLSVGSEVDVVCKELCHHIDNSNNPKNINEYKEIILGKFPLISTTPVMLTRYKEKIIPWKSWSKGSNPEWWKAYNNVKHHRNKNYNDANQVNVMHAMSAHLVLVLYLYRLVNGDEHKRGTKIFDAPGTGMGHGFLIKNSLA